MTTLFPVRGGIRTIDFAYAVQDALANGPLNSTQLTEAVWGTSGRGSTALTQVLFPIMIKQGWITMRRQGASKIYALGRLIDQRN